MKTLVTLLLACCFGSAMAQSNLPACPTNVGVLWTNCYGTYTYPNGDKYVGEYKDGEQHGQGTYTFPNRDKYVGEFKDAQRNGQGTYTYADGSKYVGEYKDDKFNGQGTYTYANGNKYVGEFKDHNFNGQGIKYLANGKVDKSGIWKDDKLVQSKFIDVATFTRIPNLSNSASNLAQLRKTEEQEKQKQAELEAQRKATELAITQATQAAKQVTSNAPEVASTRFKIRPINGALVEAFTDAKMGVVFEGEGRSVKAVGDGLVVWAQSGLRGYPEAIIIKHDDRFLTVYANNKKMLVNKGDYVQQGSEIALAGPTLLFEVRLLGKAVDPLSYIPKEAAPDNRVESSVSRRLIELQKLFGRGLISEPEYETKREEILNSL